MSILAIYLLATCCSSQNAFHHTFLKYKIGASTPIDSMHVTVKGGVYFIHNERSKLSNHFKFDDANEKLFFKPGDCPSETAITLKVGAVKDIECGPLFPFLGERVTILDKRVFSSDGKAYTIFKLYNETGASNLNNSTVFWVENCCIIMIKLNGGEYYVIDEWNPNLIKKIKQDLDFSELWPIPPVPPVPQFEN